MVAKRVIYNCDRCGEETPENRLFAVFIRHRSGREIIAINGADNEPELCAECVDKVISSVKGEWPNLEGGD